MKKMKLALVAHDSKKDDMVRLVKAHREGLKGLELMATRSTGRVIQERTGLAVRLLESGPLGGDQQVGALVEPGDPVALAEGIVAFVRGGFKEKARRAAVDLMRRDFSWEKTVSRIEGVYERCLAR